MVRETKARFQVLLPKPMIEEIRRLIKEEPWCANHVDDFVLNAVRQKVEAYWEAL